MYVSIQLDHANAPSRQASSNERTTESSKPGVQSRRRLLLALLILLLAASLAVQVTGVGSRADTIPSQMPAPEASTQDAAPVTEPSPGPEDWVDTSPYGQEPLSISGGATGLNLPQ